MNPLFLNVLILYTFYTTNELLSRIVQQISHFIKMKGTHVGELEELVLLTVGSLFDEAYGVAVMDEVRENAGRDMNISAIHAVLRRLEEKGLLSSRMGGSTNERGGRRKRLFTLTKEGKQVLDHSIALRQSLYDRIPDIKYNFSI